MSTFLRVSIFFLFLLSACNFPNLAGTTPGPTVVPDTAPAPVTDLPTQDYNYSECGFVWAREPLPELSQEFDAALKEALPQASGRAEAYGENCINNTGEVVRFLAMETDFDITVKVETLADKQLLGNLIEQVLDVVAQFPVEETPGPQPGYVGITFEAPGDEDRLWFPQQDAQAAIDTGLRGEELYLALHEK